MSVALYRLHGLVVASSSLDARAGAGPPDLRLTIHRGAPARPAVGGRLLAALEVGAVRHTVVQTTGGFRSDYSGIGTFDVDSAAGTIEGRLEPGADPGLVPLLVAGGVLSTHLGLLGVCTLHASAVEVAGRAVALVGASGQGKTTVAALLCAAGARLVSDDVLRVEADGRQPACWAGGARLRLRPAAAELAGALPRAPVAPTPDGRTGVRPVPTGLDRLPLEAVVLPEPDRESTGLVVERLDRRDACLALMRYPRVTGWLDPAPIRAHFTLSTALGLDVPVLRARIPWGPPFDAELGPRLLEAVGLDVGRLP